MLTGLRQTVALGVAVLVIGAHWLPGRATPPPSVPTRVEPAPVFRWPLDGPPRPVRRFDPPPLPWLPGHRGVDLAAAPGATVRAAGAGTVLFADMVAGRPVVTVGHPGGLRTTYEPVHPEVHPGDVVAAGAPLGVLLAGHPGCPTARAAAPTGSCLHWGARRGPEYLDPLALLGLGPVRLLPVAARVDVGFSQDDGSGRAGDVDGRRPRDGDAASGRRLTRGDDSDTGRRWGEGPDGVARREGWAPCRCGQRPGIRAAPTSRPPTGQPPGQSALGQQRRQPGRQPLVLVGGVVDLAAEPEPALTVPGHHRHLGGEPLGDPGP